MGCHRQLFPVVRGSNSPYTVPSCEGFNRSQPFMVRDVATAVVSVVDVSVVDMDFVFAFAFVVADFDLASSAGTDTSTSIDGISKVRNVTKARTVKTVAPNNARTGRSFSRLLRRLLTIFS